MSQPFEFMEYTTVMGDMFDGIAYDIYGNEFMASTLIYYNPQYADVIVFPAGIDLLVPIYEDEKTPESLPPWRDI